MTFIYSGCPKGAEMKKLPKACEADRWTRDNPYVFEKDGKFYETDIHGKTIGELKVVTMRVNQ